MRRSPAVHPPERKRFPSGTRLFWAGAADFAADAGGKSPIGAMGQSVIGQYGQGLWPCGSGSGGGPGCLHSEGPSKVGMGQVSGCVLELAEEDQATTRPQPDP